MTVEVPQIIGNRPESNLSEPRIVAFVCNWCTYAGADLAGTSRMQYAANVRMIRLPCTARIDVLLILRTLQEGADGVIVSGCHPGDCHYTSGNLSARRRFAVFHRLLDYLGVDQRRLQFAWVSAAEAGKWVKLVNDFTKRIKDLGPYGEFLTMCKKDTSE